MSYPSTQAAFNAVVSALREQGGPAWFGGCEYSTGDPGAGLPYRRCAVGVALPADVAWQLEARRGGTLVGDLFGDLAQYLGIDGEAHQDQRRFWIDMQGIHDSLANHVYGDDDCGSLCEETSEARDRVWLGLYLAKAHEYAQLHGLTMPERVQS